MSAKDIKYIFFFGMKIWDVFHARWVCVKLVSAQGTTYQTSQSSPSSLSLSSVKGVATSCTLQVQMGHVPATMELSSARRSSTSSVLADGCVEEDLMSESR